jgi:Phosphotransferase enzyme family
MVAQERTWSSQGGASSVPTASEVAHYLICRGLLSAAEVIVRDLEIREIFRKNSNFAVLRDQGPSYLLKLADPAEQNMGVKHEANVYRFLRDNSYAWAPRMIDYDLKHGCLILELVPDSMDMHTYHENRMDVSLTTCAKVGRALAVLHSIRPASTMPRRFPWSVTAFRPPIQMLRELSPASLEIIKALQRCPGAAENYAAVRGMWRDTNVIHFDMKWANIVVGPAPGARRITRAWLVDWELAGRGDGDWDVGCMLAQILSRWVFSFEDGDRSDFSGGVLANQARRPLDRARAGAAAFIHAYASTRQVARQELSAFLTRAGTYAGARLVHIALEAAQPLSAATAPLLLHAQLGLNIMSAPYEAVVHLLGLAPDAII